MALREINLIAADIIARRQLVRHLFLWCGGFLAVAVLMSGIYQYQTRIHYAAKQDLADGRNLSAALAMMVGESKKEQRELTIALGERSQFDALTAKLRPYSSVIATLAEIMNTQTWLQQLALDTGRDRTVHMKLSGFSSSHENLGDFIQRLSREPLFKGVILKLAQESEVRISGGSPVQFQIECDVAGR
jgi:Tfp pilus assembly protein PilN